MELERPARLAERPVVRTVGELPEAVATPCSDVDTCQCTLPLSDPCGDKDAPFPLVGPRPDFPRSRRACAGAPEAPLKASPGGLPRQGSP